MEFYYRIPSTSRDPSRLPQLSSFDARGLAPALNSHEAESSSSACLDLSA
jgi:hypothetical protein